MSLRINDQPPVATNPVAGAKPAFKGAEAPQVTEAATPEAAAATNPAQQAPAQDSVASATLTADQGKKIDAKV